MKKLFFVITFLGLCGIAHADCLTTSKKTVCQGDMVWYNIGKESPFDKFFPRYKAQPAEIISVDEIKNVAVVQNYNVAREEVTLKIEDIYVKTGCFKDVVCVGSFQIDSVPGPYGLYVYSKVDAINPDTESVVHLTQGISGYIEQVMSSDFFSRGCAGGVCVGDFVSVRDEDGSIRDFGGSWLGGHWQVVVRGINLDKTAFMLNDEFYVRDDKTNTYLYKDQMCLPSTLYQNCPAPKLFKYELDFQHPIRMIIKKGLGCNAPVFGGC